MPDPSTFLVNSNARLQKIEQSFSAKPFPDSVLLETSAYCNLNCTMCANNMIHRPKGFMNMRLYKKIVNEVASENPNASVWFAFYGEPLIIRYKLYYMIRYAKEKGLTNTYLNTNAMLLSNEIAEMIADSGLDHLIVGLDGNSPETHDKIRVGASYKTVRDNVIYLNNIIKKSNRGPKIEMQFIVMDQNEHELDDYKKFWASQHIAVKVRRRNTWGGLVDKDGYISEKLNRIACGWAVSICPITWDGQVVACGVDCDSAYSFGNVNQKTIKEIWANKQEFIKMHLEHRFNELPNFCRTCYDWQVLGHVDYDENGVRK